MVMGSFWFSLQQVPSFALLGGPLNSGEPASSSSGNVNPVASVLPFSMSKCEGKDATYLPPPWYAHHFGQSDQPAEEELAPDDNALTLPQHSFELPNDVVHSHRYMIGKGKGGPIVKGKPAYTLEFRNDKGKGRQVLMMMMLLMHGMNGVDSKKPYMQH